MTLLSCVTNWGDVLEYTMSRSGQQTCAFFFVSVVLLGQLLLLNLVLATIVDGAFDIFDDEFERQEKLDLCKKHLAKIQVSQAFEHLIRRQRK